MDGGCGSYWSLSDHLPVDTVVDYWCSDRPDCREAKRYALLTALERGDVAFRRSDGKTFDDPVYQLYEQKLILVERDSFLEWADRVSGEVEKQNLRENIAAHPKSESSYLKIIGAMVKLMLGESSGGQQHSVFKNQSAIIEAIMAHNPNTPGVSQRTLEKKFAAGKREIESN